MAKGDRAEQHVTLWHVVLHNLKVAVRGDPAVEALRLRSPELHWLARHPAALFLRHLDCGSCNACDEELAALTNPVYDIEQYGIYFCCSPMNATHLTMTGPLTRGLVQPALLTCEQMPTPAIIAVGDCALGRGPFADSYAIARRPPELEEAIQLRIPGCPPSPQTILQALASWLVEARDRAPRA